MISFLRSNRSMINAWLRLKERRLWWIQSLRKSKDLSVIYGRRFLVTLQLQHMNLLLGKNQYQPNDLLGYFPKIMKRKKNFEVDANSRPTRQVELITSKLFEFSPIFLCVVYIFVDGPFGRPIKDQQCCRLIPRVLEVGQSVRPDI